MAKKDNDKASRPDKNNPEWTREEICTARPVMEVFSEVFGSQAVQTLKLSRGRPPKANKKINQTLRLDADVLNAYRSEGKGWQTHINQILRDHMPGGSK